jgi:3'-5' exoribonuclease
MSRVQLSEIQEGESFRGFFLVKKKAVRTASSGAPYWDLTLQDATGQCHAKVWSEVLASHEGVAVEEGSVLKVEAVTERYDGRLQLRVMRFRLSRPEDGIDAAELMPRTPHDIDVMYEELLGFVDRVENPHLKRLLESFFREDEAFAQRFKYCSASRAIHHPYVGGLLEHVVSLLKICEFLASHYPDVDRDILFAGAVFHDVGKVAELDGFSYSTEGELLGHVAIGFEMVRERMRSIEGFPEPLSLSLSHMVLCHQGELDWGAPVVPKTREAMILHFADNMDAKLFQCYQSLQGTADSVKEWSESNWLLRRRFWRGAETSQEAESLTPKASGNGNLHEDVIPITKIR